MNVSTAKSLLQDMGALRHERSRRNATDTRSQGFWLRLLGYVYR